MFNNLAIVIHQSLPRQNSLICQSFTPPEFYAMHTCTFDANMANQSFVEMN